MDRVAVNEQLAHESAMPSCLFDDGRGEPYYGVPISDDQGEPRGIKIGHHKAGPVVDPDTVERHADRAEVQLLETAFRRHLPIATGRVHRTAVCMYSMTPDGHFIVDRLPGTERVTVACGFSGHGFKFAPVIGEAVADLSLRGQSNLPISFLKTCRPTLSARS